MAGFIITCETCQTRLRVNDDGAAGQIHPCPKCGGMVAVVPPSAASASESIEIQSASSATVGFLLGKPAIAWIIGGSILFAAVGMVTLFATQNADESSTVAEVTATPPAAEPKSDPPPVHSADQSPSDNDVVSEPTEELQKDTPVELDAPSQKVAATEPEETITSPVSSEPFDPLNADPAQFELATDSEAVQSVVPAGASDEAEERAPLAPKPNVFIELGPTDTNQPASRSAAKQLALKLESVDLPAVPLADALEMISDLAAMPVTIEPATLRMAGITARSPVTFSAADVTLAEFLTNVLAKHRLARSDLDDQIIIRHVLEEQSQTVDYKVADLITPDADAADLAAIVQQMIEPSSWQRAGGRGHIGVEEGAVLKLRNGRRPLFDVLIFCERLRLVRGLPKKSRISPDLLLTESPYAALQPALEKKTTFTFPAWTPLKQMFRYFGQETGTTMLVDWPALSELDLNPHSQVMCSAIDARWDASLDAMLQSLELTWIAVDPKTIWITSRTAASELSAVQFYSVDANVLAEFSSPKALIESLRDEFSGAQLEYDAPSKHLIVLAPESIHRQLFSRLSGHEPPSIAHPRLSQSAAPAP